MAPPQSRELTASRLLLLLLLCAACAAVEADNLYATPISISPQRRHDETFTLPTLATPDGVVLTPSLTNTATLQCGSVAATASVFEFIYTPNITLFGASGCTDTFGYRLSGGGLSETSTVTAAIGALPRDRTTALKAGMCLPGQRGWSRLYLQQN